MFQVGDKIFYPMHGAGVIKAIEEKEILGEKKVYYVLNLSLSNMHVMIPAREDSHALLRDVVDSDTLRQALQTCHQEEESPTVYHPQHKHRIFMDKIKSGDIFEGAQVIRDLMVLGKEKKLNTNDKALLNQAQQLLISELSLVMNVDQEQASQLLNDPLQVQ